MDLPWSSPGKEKICIDLTGLPVGRWETHGEFNKFEGGEIVVQRTSVYNLCNELQPQVNRLEGQLGYSIGLNMTLGVLLILAAGAVFQRRKPYR